VGAAPVKAVEQTPDFGRGQRLHRSAPRHVDARQLVHRDVAGTFDPAEAQEAHVGLDRRDLAVGRGGTVSAFGAQPADELQQRRSVQEGDSAFVHEPFAEPQIDKRPVHSGLPMVGDLNLPLSELLDVDAELGRGDPRAASVFSPGWRCDRAAAVLRLRC
jgi:hypothetical protein